jgi:hypothetical protein
MRRSASLLLVVALTVVAHLWVPGPVAGCSCVDQATVLESAGGDPGSSVFTATTGIKVGTSIPVLITRWFRGPVPGGQAVIEGGQDGDMCGPTSPPAGGEYLFVTYTSETSRLAISGCSVQADLDTPDGAAMLARAIELYGQGAAAQPTVAAQPSPAVSSSPAVTTAVPGAVEPATGPYAALVTTAVPVIMVIAFGLGVVGGLLLILRRRRD